MKRLDLSNVREAGEFEKVPAGAYICVITKVEDFEKQEKLVVYYDIAEGEYAGHYERTRNEKGWDWYGRYTKSYKTTAQRFFKRFCTSVSKSNGNFVFDAGAVNADEQTLVGKKIGLVFQEEEYYSNSGDKRTRLIVDHEFSISKIADQKTPAPKLLPEEPAGSDAFMSIPDGIEEEMPFA